MFVIEPPQPALLSMKSAGEHCCIRYAKCSSRLESHWAKMPQRRFVCDNLDHAHRLDAKKNGFENSKPSFETRFSVQARDETGYPGKR
jgi:hypothetical protein